MSNKYLEKIATMVKAPSPPRSEKAVKKHRIVHPPKLKKFTAKIGKHHK